MDEDYILVKPRDVKAYPGWFTAGVEMEPIAVYIHTGCGNLVGNVETHRRTCPEQAQ